MSPKGHRAAAGPVAAAATTGVPVEENGRHTFTQQVIDYVRDALRQGIFKPGSPITEQMLADALGASRAPIREALQTLTNEGVICSYPYRGRVIREMNPQEILDTAYLVGVIEGALAVRALPHLTAVEFDRLEALVGAMERAARTGSGIDEIERLGSEFHQLLCGGGHLAGFALHTRKICKDISRLLYYRYWREIFSLAERARRHRFLLEAVRTGDVLYIDAVFRRHHMEVGEGICRMLAAELSAREAGDKGERSPTPGVGHGGAA